MADKVKVAMIGCGGIAGAHRKGLEQLWNAGYKSFEVVATCDILRQNAENMAAELAKFQGSTPVVIESVESLLSDGPEFDAADICTLHSEHHTTSIPCFEAGKHVTIEKPLGITLRAGKMMLEAAEKSGKILHVAEQYRMGESHRAIKWAIEQGMVGDVRMMYWIDVGQRLWYWGWREHKFEAGAGWALDGGVHHCDLFRYFLGQAVSVHATHKAFFPFRYKDEENKAGKTKVDVEDTSMTVIEFESGALGMWISTSAAPGEGFSKHAVYGDNGSIVWDTGLKSPDHEMSMEELVKTHQGSISKAEMERLFPMGIKDGIAIELHQFFEAVQGRGQVETDGLEGYKAEAMALALFESDALGRKVTLSEVENLEVEEYQSEINRKLGIT